MTLLVVTDIPLLDLELVLIDTTVTNILSFCYKFRDDRDDSAMMLASSLNIIDYTSN